MDANWLGIISWRMCSERCPTPLCRRCQASNSRTSPREFDETAQALGLLLATHGALALTVAAVRERASNLEVALRTSRQIGIAMGVLMFQHKLTEDQAFDLLRIASQHKHLKLAAIASVVAENRTPRTSCRGDPRSHCRQPDDRAIRRADDAGALAVLEAETPASGQRAPRPADRRTRRLET